MTILCFALAAAFALPATAQEPARSGSGEATSLPGITVLGDSTKTSPLDFTPTVDEISGERLERRRAATLGETLSRETGVTSSFFGPNASRPVIRGLEGERLRVLSDGTGVLDASAASADHAVAVEPLAVERIEILRGPGALLYGSGAVGGVVNVVTGRIPEEAQEKTEGKALVRGTTVDNGGDGVLVLDTGAGPWAFRLEGSARTAGDYKIPGFARSRELRDSDPLPPGEDETKDKVVNAFNRTASGTFGASYIFDRGFAGAAYTQYESQYGTVAEPDVAIHLVQRRADGAVGWKDVGVFDSVKLKLTSSEYRHAEMEGPEEGTVFKNRGTESRLELKHRPFGPLQGLIGAQVNAFKFEALGEEAFVPPTDNASQAVFMFEEIPLGAWTPSFGLRLENTSVAAHAVEDNPSFAAADKRTFAGTSASAGLKYDVNERHAVVLNLSRTERAPNYQELFANGPHMATGVFEIGDRDFKKETSQAAELSYRLKGERTRGSIGVFVQDFDGFIALSPTGATQTTPDGDVLPEFRYRSVKARLEGAELDVTHELPGLLPGGVTEIGLKVDTVRGRDRTAGENLPRITPTRETLSAVYRTDRWSADAEIQRAERQRDLAPNEVATDAYELVNVGFNRTLTSGTTVWTLSARVNNLFDREARNHVSLLKDIAPLPGRGLIVGLQALF